MSQPRSQWTVASYNISPEDRAGARRRIKQVLETRGLIFLGMQEARWYGKERLPESARKAGWRRPINGDVDEQVVFRNAQGFVGKGSVVTRLAEGKSHWIEPAAAGPTKADERTISWVFGEVDGQPLAMGDLHLVPSVQFKKADALSEAQIASVHAAVAYWLAHGYQVVLLGDFNLQPNHPNLRPLLNGFPLPGERRQVGRLRIANSDWTHSKGTRGTRRQIDLVFVSDGLEVVATRTAPGHRDDDHRIPFVRCRMKADLPAVKPTPPKPPAKEPNMLPANLPQILRDHGLKVVEVDGWQNRRRPGQFAPVGALCHHTATGPKVSDAATLNLLIRGRPDLPGPLCQLGLGRDGTVYVIARGRSNHGGKAKSSGTVAAGDANRLYIGIEAFNDGRGEKWPAAQYDAYVRLAAVLCVKVTGNSAETVRGHKETSVTGKIDPTFSMPDFRERVAAEIAGMRTTPAPKPAKNRTLKVTNPRMSGDDVRWVQSFFAIKQDGVYGVKTRAAIRRFQVRHGIEPVSGEVGPRTRKVLRQIEKDRK